MEYPPVLTKRDFTRRYAASEFGNGSPTWLSLESFLVAGPHEGLYHLRNGAVAGGTTYYKQTPEEVVKRWASIDNPKDWYCSKQIPDKVEKRLLIQGEVMQADGTLGMVGLYLFYSRVPKPMRQALAENSISVSGIIAVTLLKYLMCPNSWEWLNVLLDRYPEHVVEFSTYDCEWGTIPGYNTVYWEVRSY